MDVARFCRKLMYRDKYNMTKSDLLAAEGKRRTDEMPDYSYHPKRCEGCHKILPKRRKHKSRIYQVCGDVCRKRVMRRKRDETKIS